MHIIWACWSACVRAHVRRARACACGNSCCTARALNSSRMVCLESSSVVVEQGYWLVPGHCRCILYLSKWRLYSRDCEGLWSFSTYRVFMPCKNRWFAESLKVRKSRNDFCKQKTNDRILLYYYETSCWIVFVWFLEEIEVTKKTFRNWLTFICLLFWMVVLTIFSYGSALQPQKPIIFVIVVVLLSWRLVVMWSCHCLHFNSKSLLIRIVLLTWYAIFVFIKDSTDNLAVIRHLCCQIVKKSVRLVFYCAAFGAERLFSLFWDLFWFLYWDDDGLSLNLLSSTGNFTAA